MSLFKREAEKCSEEKRERTKQWFRKYAPSQPPYNFVVNYTKLMFTYDDNSAEAEFARTFASVLSMESNKDINTELRLIELEKDLISIVETTDNKIFYRNLFFPSIFINNNFNYEGLIIKGIYVTECYSLPGSDKYTLHYPVPNDYAIFLVAIDLEQGCEFYTCFALANRALGPNFTDNKEEDKLMQKLNDYARTLICNIVDMVEGNDKDLDVVIIETNKEQNLKRIKRDQIPIPTKVFIRAKTEFKKYLRKFNDEGEKRGFSHKFLVRGHWRHFRDNKFVKAKGTKKWVKSYWKGEGIIISKDYILKDKMSDT